MIWYIYYPINYQRRCAIWFTLLIPAMVTKETQRERAKDCPYLFGFRCLVCFGSFWHSLYGCKGLVYLTVSRRLWGNLRLFQTWATVACISKHVGKAIIVILFHAIIIWVPALRINPGGLAADFRKQYSCLGHLKWCVYGLKESSRTRDHLLLWLLQRLYGG